MSGHGKKEKEAQQPAHVTYFVQTHAAEANAISAKTSVPAEVILAQSAIESGWGRKVKGNACFGVKGKSTAGNSTTFTTHEYPAQGKVVAQAQFMAYTGYQEAAEGYASLISRNYSSALVHKDDPVKFAQEVAKHGYASDPDYAKKLESIIKGHIPPVLEKKP